MSLRSANLAVLPSLSNAGEIRALALGGRILDAIEAGKRLWPELTADSIAQADLSELLAWLGFQSGRAEDALHFATHVTDVGERTSDLPRMARGLALAAWLQLEVGRGEEAAEAAAQALMLVEDSGDLRSLSWAVSAMAVVCWYCRQLDRALVLAERAVSLSRGLGDPPMYGCWLVNLGGVHLELSRGDRRAGRAVLAAEQMRQAIAYTEEARVVAQQAGDVWGESLALLNLADIHAREASLDAAQALFQAAMELPMIQSDRVLVHGLEVRARIQLLLQQPAEAVITLSQALATAEAIACQESIVECQRELAAAHEQLGAHELALRFYKRYHRAEAAIVAERVQDRARMTEVMLDTRRLQAKIEAASQERDRLASSCAILEREALADALTGLANRRRIDAWLQQALAAPAARVAVAVIDLDLFKSINDRFGHAIGDRVLCDVACILSQGMRETDLVGRLGGEEFILLLDGFSVPHGTQICGRLRRAVRDFNWNRLAPGLRVTASFGIALASEIPPAEAYRPAALLALADRRLYRAKRLGRNRICQRGEG